jgi:hypothetical protein
MKGIYHFLFFCFYNMVVFNKSDRHIERASFGLAVSCITSILAILFLLLTYFDDVRLNSVNMCILIFISIPFLSYINFSYFKNKLNNSEIMDRYNNLVSKKNYIIVGTMFFLSSFLFFVLAGKNYSKHRKEIKRHTSLIP